MDAHTFDRWTTDIARHSTRRTALRFLAGSLLGGLLARRGSMSARAAQIDDVGFTDTVPLPLCEAQGLTDCAGYCADTTSDPANCGACGNVCPAGDACVGGWCQTFAVSDIGACVTGLTYCGGDCVDLATDQDNCGACYTFCILPDTCQNGQCVCQSGFTRCYSQSWEACSDLSSDPWNCGACFNRCASGQVCQGGQCRS